MTLDVLGLAVDLEREAGELAVGSVFDQGDGLKVRIADHGLEAGFGELGGNPLDGDFGAAFEGHAAVEGIGG